MQIFQGMNDIRLGYNTDISFENNDLMLTSGNDYIELEIYKLLITSPGDWKASPLLGCSPNDFTGDSNSRETGKKIEQYLINGLKDTIYPAQVSVRCVPTNYTTMMIFVDILFQNIEIDSIPFEFDFVNGIKKFDKIDKKITETRSSESYKINNIANLKRPNKYYDRIRQERL